MHRKSVSQLFVQQPFDGFTNHVCEVFWPATVSNVYTLLWTVQYHCCLFTLSHWKYGIVIGKLVIPW